MRAFHWASLTIIALFFAAPAVAQAPAPAAVPDVMPFDIPFGAPISLERAKQIGDAAVAEAKKRNWKMVIVIVEPTGDLVYFQKMDGTQYASIKIAPGKAQTAARYRRPSKAFNEQMETGHPYVATLDGVVASEGGVPIVENGKLIGAIGVSGGNAEQDIAVSNAGLAALAQ